MKFSFFSSSMFSGFAVVATWLLPFVSQGQVTVDPSAPAGSRPGLDAAPNGVPLVNIAAPNGRGLSHNLYTDYNVGSGGLILNNLTGKYGETALGGVIFANPNLRNGAATMILNEVTGSGRSELRGFTEVAGQGAHVIVANPNGIYVDGAGFINTPRVTLTTGRPEWDGAGGLVGYRVENGTIRIDGRGLSAPDADAFEILSRTASFAADVHVKGELRVLAGRNRVNHETGEAESLEDDGLDKPEVAIDSSELGGMYAGKIRLEATEKGVGVNLKGVVSANAGDLIARAKGDVSVRKASAKGKVRIRSEEKKVRVTESVAADGDLELESDRGDVEIGDGAVVAAGSGLNIKAGGTARIGMNGKLASRKSASVTAGEFRQQGEALAVGDFSITTSGLFWNEGMTGAGRAVVVSAGRAENGGAIVSEGSLAFGVSGILENSGTVQSTGALHSVVSGNTSNLAGGLIQSGGGLSWKSGGALTNAGRMLSGGGASLISGGVLLNEGRIAAQDLLILEGEAVENRGGLVSLGGFTLRTDGNLTNGAEISVAGGIVAVVGGDVVNAAGASVSAGGSSDWKVSGELRNAGDFLSTDTAVVSVGTEFLNTGRMDAERRLSVLVEGMFRNEAAVSSGGDLEVSAAELENVYGAALVAKDRLLLSVDGDAANAGTLFSAGTLRVGLDGDFGNTGNLISTGDLTVEGRVAGSRAGSIVNSSAVIESSSGSIILRGETIENKRTHLEISRGEIDLGEGEREVINNFIHVYNFAGYHITNAHQLPRRFMQHFPVDDPSFKNFYRNIPYHERTNDLVITRQRYRDVLLADSGASFIRAGADITLDAAGILNHASQISAAGDITISGGILSNQGDALLERLDTISRQEYFTVYRTEQLSGDDEWGTKFEWADPVTETAYEVIDPFHATIEAGGTITGSIDALSNSDIRSGVEIVPGGPFDPAFVRPPSEPLPTLGRELDPSLSYLGSLGQLMIRTTDPQAAYLYETRPEFAGLGHFLGSDYFFGRLGLENNATENLLKRLGDAYFETQFVLNQLYELTGRRFLGAPESDLELMKRLMDNGLSAALDLQLTPGVSLTAEQFNRLKEDLVWMEERVVDGQRVMVPVVYLSEATLAKINSGTATITAGNIGFDAGVITNSGTLAAREILALETGTLLNLGGLLSDGTLLVDAAGSIVNRSGTIHGGDVVLSAGGDLINTTATVLRTDVTGGRESNHTQAGNTGSITASGNLTLQAGRDLINLGAGLGAGEDVTLRAGNDILLGGVETRSEAHVRGDGFNIDIARTGHIGSEVTVGGGLSLLAGRDAILAGADLDIAGDASLGAMRDLSITTLTDTLDVIGSVKGHNIKNSGTLHRTTEVGTLLTTEGDLTLAGGRDLTVRGSTLASEGDMALSATRDLSIIAGWEHESTTDVTKKTGSGFFSRDSKETVHGENHGVFQSQLLSKGKITLQSGGLATLEAARVLSGDDLSITAAGGIDLAAATTSSLERVKQKSESILTQGKFSSTETWASDVGTTLASDKDITLSTAGDMTAKAAHVSAGKNLTVDVAGTFLAEEGRSTHTLDTKSSSSGLGITAVTTSTGASVSKGYTSFKEKTHLAEDFSLLGSWSAGEDATFRSGGDLTLQGQIVDAGKNLTLTSGGDLSVLAALDHSENSFERSDFFIGSTTSVKVHGLLVDTALAVDAAGDRDSGTNALQGAVTARGVYDATQGGALLGITLSEAFGYNKSEQSGANSSTTAAASSLTAGEMLGLSAEHDLRITGSDVVGKDVRLSAGNDILLSSQRETMSGEHEESASNASVGASVTATVGAQGAGVAVTVDVAFGGSEAKGSMSGVTHRETNVFGSDSLTLESGRNTELTGALVSGGKITADIGGNLLLMSQQDLYRMSEEASSYGVNLSIPVYMIGAVGIQASGSFQDQSAAAAIASVVEQTGLYAGEGGFDIRVGGNTSLTGAVIASDATTDKNRLETGGLTMTDLRNTSEWEAETKGMSGSVSLAGRNEAGEKSGQTQAGLGTSLPQSEGEKETGMTRSAIAAGTIVTGDGTDISTVNRDTAGANNGALSMELPDLQQILSQQADRAAVAQQASAAVARTVGDMADHLMEEAVRNRDLEMAQAWAEGGVNRALAHGVSQAIVAGLGGGDALGGGLGAAAGSYLTPSFAGVTGNEAMDKLLGNIAAGVIGHAVGGGSGSFTSGSVELNNRQLHPLEKVIIRLSAEEYAAQYNEANPGAPITQEEAQAFLQMAAWYGTDPNVKAAWDAVLLDGDPQLKGRFESALSFLRGQGPDQFQVLSTGMDWFGFGNPTLPFYNGGGEDLKLFAPDGREQQTFVANMLRSGGEHQKQVVLDILSGPDPVLGLAALNYGREISYFSSVYGNGKGSTSTMAEDARRVHEAESYLDHVLRQHNSYNGTQITLGEMQAASVSLATNLREAYREDRPVSTFVYENDDAIVGVIMGGGGIAKAGLRAILRGGGEVVANNAVRAGLLDDLVKAGVKHTPEEIIEIRRLADGSIAFLEKGNARAGLQHIVQGHVDDFAKKGIPEGQIPNAIFEALTNGKVVGTSGTGRNVRSIYEFIFNGQTQRIGVGIADNGFIVTAFPH